MKIRVLVAVVALSLVTWVSVCAQTPTGGTGAQAITKVVGAIKSVQAGAVAVVPDSGGEVTATLGTSTKILRVPPGQKDLKNATVLEPQDLQPGDRVLVRGSASPDGHSVSALAVIVMKQADVSAKQQRERDDWQKRGVGGLVNAVDAANSAITISSSGFGGNRNIVIHTAKDTILRRYAPGSVKFDEAKRAPFDQIKVGDQLRARGSRSADGNELSAEEVVSGTFRNIAGTITAIDPGASTVTVRDAIAKNTVVVRVSSDAQMKKLPAEFAQRIAMRLKAGTAEAGNAAGASGFRPPGSGGPPGTWAQFPRGQGGLQGERGNGPPDFQRLLGRLPTSTLADLQKGDAVMIVSTVGEESGAVKAITVLAGVEPILTAAPSQSASMMLSPWTLNSSGAEGEAAAP